MFPRVTRRIAIFLFTLDDLETDYHLDCTVTNDAVRSSVATVDHCSIHYRDYK
jgi:hypothetical protein